MSPGLLGLDRPLALRRRGVETRIVAGEIEPRPDDTLIRVLAEARFWARSLRSGMSLAAIAAATGHSEPYIRMRSPLAFLAPRLQATILDGRQSPILSVARLLRAGIPVDWTDQERLFADA